jgi:hypothetical protein
MPSAPWQLWVDIAPLSSVTAVGGTVTVTTQSAHGATVGAYVQLSGLTAAGTTMLGVAPVATVTSGTVFTCVISGASGTATVDRGVLSYDLMSPLTNYTSAAARMPSFGVELDSLNLSSNGDGTGSSMGFTVSQEVTPSVGPWFNLIPDNARIRLCEKTTGTTPTASDVRFLGFIQGIDYTMNESGQGSIAQITCSDATTVLDRLGVFGKAVAVFKPRTMSRSSNIVTVSSTTRDHGFSVGQQVRVSNAIGGGTVSFNGIFTISGTAISTVGARTTYSFTYAQTGPGVSEGRKADTSLGSNYISVSVSRVGNASDKIRITGTGDNQINAESGCTLGLFSVTVGAFTNRALAESLFNAEFSGNQVIVISPTVVELILAKPLPGTWGTIGGGVISNGSPNIGVPNVNGQIIVTIASGATETQAVTTFLSTVNAYKGGDPVLQRLFTTTDTSQIIGGTASTNPQEVQFPATTLRSALDAIVETYTGTNQDTRARRYFIDVQGRLNYKLVDAASQPTYADAPYSITTASEGSPNTSTSKATVAPYALSVNSDHQTVKSALFSIPSTAGTVLAAAYEYDSITSNATFGTSLYPNRPGAPYFDAIVEFPTAVKNPSTKIQAAAVAWFAEAHRPMISGSLELRGGGTLSFNQLGFSSGYAQSAFTIGSASRAGSVVTLTTTAAHQMLGGNTIVVAGITSTAGLTMNGTFSIGTVANGTTLNYTAAGSAGAGTVTAATAFGYRLVSGWYVGQFMEVSSPTLGLSGKYRVEEVSWSLEPGSYLQRIRVSFNRKNPNDLATLVAGSRT